MVFRVVSAIVALGSAAEATPLDLKWLQWPAHKSREDAPQEPLPRVGHTLEGLGAAVPSNPIHCLNPAGGCGLSEIAKRATGAIGGSSTLHKAFHYADIAAYLLEKPSDRTPDVCRELCIANATCAAWEVCAPLGDGCDGCYMVKRAPKRLTERDGWHAEVLEGREELGWDGNASDPFNMTLENCHKFITEANGADQGTPFHEPAIMQRYTSCGILLRDSEEARRVAIVGQHWPTIVLTNFWDPPVGLTQEMEQAMLSTSGRQVRTPRGQNFDQGITASLHAQIGTTVWEDHLKLKPQGPHAFLLPFYDTNIGHWMKQHGSMNPLQSYEMQSLLAPGDVVVDVGANLGCYTIPFAERVGVTGKVLAFEPFRWLQQVTAGNVAMNGLANVWVVPVGLGAVRDRVEARPPQLKFFSSPGGMKLKGQQDKLKTDEALQLYDWDSGPEFINVVPLDDILFQTDYATHLLGVPAVDDVRLIKIDVEGMEKEVIAGAKETVRRYKPIIWTENVAYFESKGQDVSFLQLMDELEYTCAKAQNAPNDVVCMDRLGRGHQIA